MTHELYVRLGTCSTHARIDAHLQVEDDGETYTFWEDMLWPPLHGKSARLVSDPLP